MVCYEVRMLEFSYNELLLDLLLQKFIGYYIYYL